MSGGSGSDGPAAGLNVVVPLGGLGTRFRDFARPKPFVPVLGKPILEWVLDSLTLGPDDTLVLVFDPNFMGMGHFVRELVVRCQCTVRRQCTLVELAGPTRGAAETVLIGLRGLPDALHGRPTMLVDGDTFYTEDVVGRFRSAEGNAVFCFHDAQEERPIYSYVKLGRADEVLEVREKVKISDWANSGCYCFADGGQLMAECEALVESGGAQLSQDGVAELYTSGIIAAMIARGERFTALKLHVHEIHVLGTPGQVEAFCRTWRGERPRRRFTFEEAVLATAESADLVRRLRADGHHICIQSPRPREELAALMQRLQVPYDELRADCEVADFHVGHGNSVDAMVGPLHKQLGF